jgi:hypothetical protein
MRGRIEIWLIVATGVVLVLTAIIGQQAAPGSALLDPRRSTYLEGPEGSKGLADVLERLGSEVVRRRGPLFDLTTAKPAGSSDSSILAILDVSESYPTAEEHRTVRNYVAAGHRVFLVGVNGLERCFAHRVRSVGQGTRDSVLSLARPRDIDVLPDVRAIVARVPSDSLYDEDSPERDECPVLLPTGVDTLLRTVSGMPEAVRLTFRRGGEVIILADSRLVSNRALRDTDAGLVVVPWLTGGGSPVVAFDEYHHGFRDRRSMFAAAWGWALRSPLGWMMLQLGAVSLLAIGYAMVRFGPALRAVERRRRSPLEHLEALATGLQRADGSTIAIDRITAGLRRRLGRTGAVRSDAHDAGAWLSALALAVRTPQARVTVRRLGEIVREPGGDDQVLAAALAVEDVWEALGQSSRPAAS